MLLGFGMRLTPLAGFGLVLGYSRERGFCLPANPTEYTYYVSTRKWLK
jgi:hypothetical protein